MIRNLPKTEPESNQSKQPAMSTPTVAQLRKHGVTDDTELHLEFSFQTSLTSDAAELELSLKHLGRDVEYRQPVANNGTIIVIGWETPVKTNEPSTVEWSDQMCRTGTTDDCGFDGWGTIPGQ